MQNGRAIETVEGSDQDGEYVQSRVLLRIAPFVFTPSGESPEICKAVEFSDSKGEQSMHISCLSA